MRSHDVQETMMSMDQGLGHRLVGVAALAMLAAIGLSACSSEEPEMRAQDPTPTESSSSADQEASSYLLAEDDLPDGWRHATGEQHLGRPVVCGVVLEPEDLAGVDTIRYTKGFSGPFVIQYSFVAGSEDSAAATADALADKVGTCDTMRFEDNKATVTPIRDIASVGTGFSAVRVQLEDGARRDVVTFRDGTHVTVLLGYSLAGTPPPAHADVAAMAATIAAGS